MSSKKRKLCSILIALLLIVQLLPLHAALALDGAESDASGAAEDPGGTVIPLAVGIGTGGTDDLTGTEYLNIHRADAAERPTTIKITAPDGTDLPGTEGDGTILYENVPTGARLQLTLGFDLSEGDGETIYEYDGTEFFTFQLPQGITFQPADEIAIKAGGTGPLIATGSISGGKLTVRFNSTIAGGRGIWGYIDLNGTFDSMASGSPEETSFMLDEQTIVIRRDPQDPKPPAGEINLDKNGAYDPYNNAITWTVTVTPAADDEPLGGYTLIDTYSDNQTYVTNSFSVDTDPDLTGTLTHAGNSLTYVFPAAAQGKQVISYRTTVAAGSYDPTTPFVNNAALYEPDGSTPLKEAQKTINPGTVIKKEGSTIVPDENGKINWVVTVTLPAASDGNHYPLPNARIVDVMDPRLELVGAVVYHYDGGGGVLSEDTTAPPAPGTYSFELAGEGGEGNTLTFQFPTEQPHSGKTAELQYSTQVRDWDNTADHNDSLSFKNNARFEWTPEGGDGTGPAISFGTGTVEKRLRREDTSAKPSSARRGRPMRARPTTSLNGRSPSTPTESA